MIHQDDIDPTRAAQITENIDRTFDFVRDVLDRPQILEVIPHESMLMFRYVKERERTLRLTAYLPKHPGAGWGARVTGATATAVAAVSPASERRTSQAPIDRMPSVAGFESAEAAFDALEAEISAVGSLAPAARRAVGT